MSLQNIGIPKGTRDFSPHEMSRRNYIFNLIRENFELYGYQQIETPAMENLSTLLGKYGEEGDRLLFKVLNSGDFLSSFNRDQLTFISKENTSALSTKICEKGLRYDLTVPFARYVVQHRNEISFPFKRYQMQPVWRADKPQKGRYREFFQCDVDTIGSNSLLNEIELIQIIDDIFNKFGVKILIKVNNRKILSGIAEITGEGDKITEIITAIDKLDKIGIDNVNKELEDKGVSKEAISKIQPIMNFTGSNENKISIIKTILKNSETGLKGIEETEILFSYLNELGIKSDIKLDFVLARGLNYYTGTIIEVNAVDVQIGSICGGGRYDNLTGIFGLKDISGVGISFGADRIYDVLNELKIFPECVSSATKALFINFGGESEKYCLKILRSMRLSGINAEIFPSADKLKKQMQYANNKQIPFVVIVGEDELKEKILTLKNMNSGEQRKVDELTINSLVC